MPFDDKLKKIQNELVRDTETEGILLVCVVKTNYMKSIECYNDMACHKEVEEIVIRVAEHCSLNGLFVYHFGILNHSQLQ